MDYIPPLTIVDKSNKCDTNASFGLAWMPSSWVKMQRRSLSLPQLRPDDDS